MIFKVKYSILKRVLSTSSVHFYEHFHKFLSPFFVFVFVLEGDANPHFTVQSLYFFFVSFLYTNPCCAKQSSLFQGDYAQKA